MMPKCLSDVSILCSRTIFGCVSCFKMPTSRMILAIRVGLLPTASLLISLMATWSGGVSTQAIGPQWQQEKRTWTPPSCFHPSLTFPNSPSPIVLPRM